MPTWLRLLAVLIGSGTIVLLVLAANLKPDERGFGTHQQLGLPPCTVRALFGIRCPSCGMTTAWAHMMRGQVLPAVASSGGGALLAVVAMIAGPWALVSACCGRWLGRIQPGLVLAVAALVVFVTMCDWLLRLV